MIERGFGKIVNIASIGGIQGSPMLTHYCVSKAADINYTQGLALKLGRHGINVNAILPGLLMTDMMSGIYDIGRVRGGDARGTRRRRESTAAPSPRADGPRQTPEDIGDLVVFSAPSGAQHSRPIDQRRRRVPDQVGVVKVAVTGSSGLIGGTLAASLAQSGVEVLRLVRDGAPPAAARPSGTRRTASSTPPRSRRRPRRAPLRTQRRRQALVSGAESGAPSGADRLGEAPSRDHRLNGRPARRARLGLRRGDLRRPRRHGARRGERRGRGFLPELTADWEASLDPARARGVRVACAPLRGRALSEERPPLAACPLFRLGLGGAIGGGRQWLSWIHLDDAVKSVRFVLDNDAVDGAFNAVAPTGHQRGIRQGLGRRAAAARGPSRAGLRRPARLRPNGRRDYLGQHAGAPQRLEALGFTFDYPAISQALQAEAAS